MGGLKSLWKSVSLQALTNAAAALQEAAVVRRAEAARRAGVVLLAAAGHSREAVRHSRAAAVDSPGAARNRDRRPASSVAHTGRDGSPEGSPAGHTKKA